MKHEAVGVTALVLISLCLVAHAEELPLYQVKAREAVDKGLNWLAARQHEDGSWSNRKYPALSGLPLWAFARSRHPDRAKIVAKAEAFVLSNAQDDGGIYRKNLLTGGLSTYNTAICMTALHALEDRSLAPTILRARKFVASSQYLGSDEYRGGFGYSRKTVIMHADMQNTASAIQAMRLTADLEDLRPSSEKRIDIDWAEAVKFIERLQNGPDAGKRNAGGFAYKPGKSTAGTDTGEEGTVVLRATGSMTYSGLLSLIYANAGRDDHRVRAAMQWARNNWSLAENPGMGDSGRYFFYNVMSKAMAAYGADSFRTDAGRAVDWRKAVMLVIISLQKDGEAAGEGYWVNEGSNRFWEGDSVLVTAYSVLALQSALGE